MNDSDKLFFLLKGPEHYAHLSGNEMLNILNGGKRKRYVSMMKSADKHFDIIMKVFSVEQNANIIKTWLSKFELPLDPTKLTTIDQFHRTHRHFIADNCQEIKGY